MKRIISSVLCLLNIVVVYCQLSCDCYDRLSLLAEFQLEEKKTELALKTYKEAWKHLPKNKRNRYHYFNMSMYYSCNNYLDSAAFYAKKALETGHKIKYLEKNKHFKPLIGSPFWPSISKTKQTLENINWEYLTTIYEMIGVDQSIRDDNQLRKWANDSIYYLIDSTNLYKLTELINKYGIPTEIKDGFNFNEVVIFLMHASMYSESMYDEVLNILYKANNEYQCSKDFIAMFIDRRQIWKFNNPQITGTWNYGAVFNPIADVKKVDSIRYQFNLLNLSDFSIRNNMKLPSGYEKIDYPKNYFCK